MLIYTYPTKQTTRSDHPRFTPKRRVDFARAAVFEEFCARDARALDHGGFRDRRSTDTPRHLGEMVGGDVDTGQRALRHWLTQAAQLGGQERDAALDVAREIARLIGCDIASLCREERW